MRLTQTGAALILNEHRGKEGIWLFFGIMV